MKTVLAEFKSETEIPESELVEKGVVVGPSPNKVLRVVVFGHCAMLVPADAAMALVLRHDFKTTPSLERLVKLSTPPVAVSPGPA